MEAKKPKTKKKILKNKTFKKTVLSFVAPKNHKAFDEAVPVNLLVGEKGLVYDKPVIKFSAEAQLSPFVVSFSRLEEKNEIANAAPQLNFALSENELQITTTNDNNLTFSHEEFSSQLLENERTATKKIHLGLPNKKAPAAILKTFCQHQNIYEPVVAPLNLQNLGLKWQKSLSNNKALPFDLPEMETGETDESEVLTWEDVVHSAWPEKTQPIIPLSIPESVTIVEKTVTRKKIDWFGGDNQIFSSLKKSYQSVTKRLQQTFTAIEKISIFKTLPLGWHRALTAFVLVSFAFVLPLHAMETIHDLQNVKSNVEQNGLSAVSKLNEAVSLITSDSAAAINSFASAEKVFSQAQTMLDGLSTTASLLLSVIPSTRTPYKSGQHLIAAGENMAVAGKKISEGLLAMQNGNLDNTGKLEILAQTFAAALSPLNEANNHLQKVEVTVLPSEYQTQFSQLQNSLPTLIATAEEATSFSQTLSQLLGADGKKRYLLLFQNNMEIRPTGGFLGSFALLDVSHGEVANLEIPQGGSYDLQGSLKKNYISPLPLQLISARWEFQDANWFPDFPTSARQVLNFYNESGGPTVDGVVAINASFVSSLLSLLGPVDMPDYDKTIDDENFLFETQKIVEYDYVNYQKTDTARKEASPKAFIGDLAATLLGKVKDLDVSTLLKVVDAGRRGLDQKDVQLYFTDENLEKMIRTFNWSGEMKSADQDFLMIVNSNLGGGKTDGVIEERANLSVTVQNDGRIINTLTITRNHQGFSGAMFTGVNNVDYLRVYVPKGSQLISATGFSIPDASLFEIPDENWEVNHEISAIEETTTVDETSGTMIAEENGKTSFGNWVQTKPGESSVVTFVYELPFSLRQEKNNFLQTVKNTLGLKPTTAYSLLTQKQSGILNRETTVSLSVPENWQTIWAPSDNKMNFDNASDQLFSAIFASL
ncbi:MAG: DUF4012 domain-containing protein [Candidatus Uhrbacteria bacterium]